MATVYTKNETLDTASDNGVVQYGLSLWLWLLVRFLCDELGWTVSASATRNAVDYGDADTADDDDLWTTEAKPAYPFAWIALYHAGLDLAVVVQTGATPNQTRIKAAYSATPYLLAGGGTATQVPALAGEEVIVGGGTDASPTFGAAPSSDSYVVQSKGDDVTGRFKHLVYPSAGGVAGCPGVFLALVELTNGDAGADDTMIVASIGTLPTKATMIDEADGVCWSRAQLGEAGEALVRCKCLEVGSIPGAASASPRTMEKPIAYIRVQRDASPADLLGRCVDLYWWGPVGPVVQTGNLSGTKDQLCLGPVCFGWDGTEPS